MRVFVCGATKGGVGKTTICAALAVEAVRRGKKVGMIDLDPQRSLSRWHRDRDSVELPALIKSEKYVERTIGKMRGQDWDWVLVDTPPGLVSIAEAAIEIADLVLVPVRASPIDTDAMDAILEMLTTHQKDYVFLLNAITPRSKLAEGARKFLEHSGDVLETEISNRLSFAYAMIGGKTAGETDRKGAGVDVAALFIELEKRMAHAREKKKRRVRRRDEVRHGE